MTLTPEEFQDEADAVFDVLGRDLIGRHSGATQIALIELLVQTIKMQPEDDQAAWTIQTILELIGGVTA